MTSDLMLHAVLQMPPDVWRDDCPIDIAQRHSRYLAASQRIEEQENELERLQHKNAELEKRIEAMERGAKTVAYSLNAIMSAGALMDNAIPQIERDFKTLEQMYLKED